MEIIRAKSVSFTGHRVINESIEKVACDTFSLIVELYHDGYDTFLSGMAEGFDLLAAEMVLKAKEEFPDIRLIAVKPYPKQTYSFSEENKKRYAIISEKADLTVMISDNYHDGVFFRRNDFLVENASYIVCYFSGERGGTMYTVRKAKKENRQIANVFLTQNSLF